MEITRVYPLKQTTPEGMSWFPRHSCTRRFVENATIVRYQETVR